MDGLGSMAMATGKLTNTVKCKDKITDNVIVDHSINNN